MIFFISLVLFILLLIISNELDIDSLFITSAIAIILMIILIIGFAIACVPISNYKAPEVISCHTYELVGDNNIYITYENGREGYNYNLNYKTGKGIKAIEASRVVVTETDKTTPKVVIIEKIERSKIPSFIRKILWDNSVKYTEYEVYVPYDSIVAINP